MKADWSEHDDNCSKSCTRSGVALLLLSAFAISMLPSLAKIDSLNALLGYISRRITLKEELNRLQADPVWSQLKASDPSAENWELGKLLTYTEEKPVELKKYSSKLGPVETMKKAEKLKLPDRLLNVIIRLLRQIAPIPIIIKTLKELSDGDLLDRARKYSYRYDISINRWELLLRSSLFQVARLGGSLPIQGKGRKIFEPDVSKLTLVQVEQLANFNLPEISETERLLNEARFTLPSIGVPLDPTSATLFVEVALLLLTVYFWIWYREARVSPNFPAPGHSSGRLQDLLRPAWCFLC